MPSEYVPTRSSGPLVEPDPVQRAVDPGAGLGTADGGRDLQVLAAGQVRIERGLLDDRPHPRERLRPLRRHRETQHAGAARARPSQPEQHPDEGGLAGAVVAEEAVRGAARDGQADAVHREPLAEALGQAQVCTAGPSWVGPAICAAGS